MRRAAVYPLTCALALVTAVALLATASALGNARVASLPPSAAATEAAVRRFYDEVNAAIRTGDATALAATISADFVDHAPPPGVTPDHAGLARYLTALHATMPEAELAVEELVAVGDRALVRVAVRGAEQRTFLGLPLAEGSKVWGSLDVVRVAGGQVVERWGTSDGLALLEPLGRIALGARLPTHQVVAIERLAVPPGGRVEVELSNDARLIHLTAGRLTIAVAPPSPNPALLATGAAGDRAAQTTKVGPGSTRTLEAGDLLALPPLTSYALRNDAGGTAHALVVALIRPGAPALGTAECDSVVPDMTPSCAGGTDLAAQTDGDVRVPAERIVTRTLAGGRTTALPRGRITVAIGRATLAPGAGLPVHAAGPALLYVEAGAVDLDADEGTAWVRRGASGNSSDLAVGRLAAGDGAQLPLGTATSLRAGDVPATVLVVTLLPAEDPSAAADTPAADA